MFLVGSATILVAMQEFEGVIMFVFATVMSYIAGLQDRKE
ncbi:MAG: hypothetical protein JWR83_1752, partial [Aeromicrobium sp.]|nr:hypothetical protein [Aeromicrobium sp.]